MKKILSIALVIGTLMSLSACDSIRHHVRDEVREVEVGDTIISDGYQDITYVPNVDLSNLDSDEPELYVNLTDVESQQVFKVDLGTQCSQYPLPKGQRFLIRFDVTASKNRPQDFYVSPYANQVSKVLCP